MLPNQFDLPPVPLVAMAVNFDTGILYGLASTTGQFWDNTLYELDKTTGSGTPLVVLSTQIFSFCFNNGVCYGVGGGGSLWSIVISTGVATLINSPSYSPLFSSSGWRLALDLTGQMYVCAILGVLPTGDELRLWKISTLGILSVTSVLIQPSGASVEPALAICFKATDLTKFWMLRLENSTLKLWNVNPLTGATTDLGATTSSSFTTLAFFPAACLHHSSLIQMEKAGQSTPIYLLQPGDRVRLADGQVGIVDQVVECPLADASNRGASHLCLIFEPDSIAPGIPTQRLAIDPGHPICKPEDFLERGHDALWMARSYATRFMSPAGKSPTLCTWETVHEHMSDNSKDAPLQQLQQSTKDTKAHLQQQPGLSHSMRFDLILQGKSVGPRAYLANGVAVLSRPSAEFPGYDHRGGLF